MYNEPDRKSNRWPGYDYKYPGLYFVTICTRHRRPRFGEIVGSEMKLNDVGEIVKQQLLWLQNHFPNVRLGQWVIMPNHVHVILEINYNFDELKINPNDIVNRDGYIVGNANKGLISDDFSVGNGRDRSLRITESIKIKPLFDIIGAFKTTSSKLIHQQGYLDFKWQKSFHDRVIRDEDELANKQNYILSNSGKWGEDRNNPQNIKK